MTGQHQCSTDQRSKSVLNPMQDALANTIAAASKLSGVAAGTVFMNAGVEERVLRPMTALEDYGGVRSAA